MVEETKEPVVPTEPVKTPTEPVKTEPEKEEEKMVSKKLYDKLATEIATYKEKVKELEKAGKTAEQLRADEIAEKEAKLIEINAQLNKAKATSLIAESKAKINLDPKVVEFDEVLQIVISDKEDITTKNATAFSKLLLSVYQKGIDDAQKDGMNSMTNNVLTGKNANGTSSLGKMFAEQANKSTQGKTDVFTKFEK